MMLVKVGSHSRFRPPARSVFRRSTNHSRPFHPPPAPLSGRQNPAPCRLSRPNFYFAGKTGALTPEIVCFAISPLGAGHSKHPVACCKALAECDLRSLLFKIQRLRIKNLFITGVIKYDLRQTLIELVRFEKFANAPTSENDSDVPFGAFSNLSRDVFFAKLTPILR
jgi:hypothetical protein